MEMKQTKEIKCANCGAMFKKEDEYCGACGKIREEIPVTYVKQETITKRQFALVPQTETNKRLEVSNIGDTIKVKVPSNYMNERCEYNDRRKILKLVILPIEEFIKVADSEIPRNGFKAIDISHVYLSDRKDAPRELYIDIDKHTNRISIQLRGKKDLLLETFNEEIFKITRLMGIKMISSGELKNNAEWKEMDPLIHKYFKYAAWEIILKVEKLNDKNLNLDV